MAGIYAADIYCDSCINKIKDEHYVGRPISEEQLSRDEWEIVHGFDDERNYASGEYPKWCDGTYESDCPQHCAGCREFMENPLTSDGEDYVKEIVREDIESGYTDSIACTVWFPFYDWIDWEDIGLCDSCGELSIVDRDCICAACDEFMG